MPTCWGNSWDQAPGLRKCQQKQEAFQEVPPIFGSPPHPDGAELPLQSLTCSITKQSKE